MKAAERNVALALSLGAGLALSAAFWVQGDRARAQQRHDLWMAYLRGPLTAYVQGSREGAHELSVAPGRAQKRDLADAIQDLDQAWIQAGDLKPGFESDPALEPLDASLQWLGATERLAEAWPLLVRRRPDQLAAAQTAAESMRRHLNLLAVQAWNQLSGDPSLAWSPGEQAESRAVLNALSRPLPQKSDKKRLRTRLRRRKGLT